MNQHTMKKILFFGVFISALFTYTACNKDFLDVEPDGLLTEDLFYTNEQDFTQAIYGAYSGIQILYYYGDESAYAFTNMLPDDDVYRPTGDFIEVDQFRWNPTIAPFRKGFGAGYKPITGANRIIASLPKADNFNPKLSDAEIDQLKKEYEAEARFLRAFSYWYLTSTYGPVPLVDKPLELSDYIVGNSTIDQLYDFMIDDLKFAEQYLNNQWPDDLKGRATKYTAKALLGKVYLYRANMKKDANDYALARDKFNEVITSSKYELVEDFASNFVHESEDGENVENNKESVFEIQYGDFGFENGWATDFTGAAEGNQRATLYVPSGFGGYGNEFLPTAGPTGLVGIYDPADIRKKATIYSAGDPYYGDKTYDPSLSPNGHHVAKYMSLNPGFFNGASNPTTNPINERLIRFSDVLLMFAEAANEAGNGPSAEAYEAINKVRRRAHGVDINSPSALYDLPMGLTKQAFFNEVKLERRKELAFEGHRYNDLKRWHQAGLINLDQLMEQHGKPEWTETNLYLPFPQTEIDRNAELKQNPGYL
jgi:hypothetical protein